MQPMVSPDARQCYNSGTRYKNCYCKSRSPAPACISEKKTFFFCNKVYLVAFMHLPHLLATEVARTRYHQYHASHNFGRTIIKVIMSHEDAWELCTVVFWARTLLLCRKKDFDIQTSLLKSLSCMIKLTIRQQWLGAARTLEWLHF